MKTSEKLNRLKILVHEAGNNCYERIKLASEILADQEWVLEAFRGDTFKAADMLETSFFHDLCGMLSIYELMHIYQKFPDKTEWQKHKWNLRVLHDLCKEAVKARGGKPRVHVKQSEFNALKEKYEEAANLLKQERKMVARLQEQVNSLCQENLFLEEKVKELEQERNKTAKTDPKLKLFA